MKLHVGVDVDSTVIHSIDVTAADVYDGNCLANPAHRRNRRKASIRSRVEHPFHTIKRVFGFGYTRLRGMMKNTNRPYVTCAMAQSRSLH
jgi:hypothetical protein